MGSKVDGFVASTERANDDIGWIALKIVKQLHLDVDPDDVFGCSDELRHLSQLKAMIKDASEAINEQIDERNAQLYDAMVQQELPNFSRKGQTFYLTSQTYVQARKELDAESPQPWLAETRRAYTYLGLGDTARALSALERATDGKEIWFVVFGVTDPIYNSIRGSERFEELVRRVGPAGAGSSVAR